MEPWCSGPTCLPVTQEIAGSNPVGSAERQKRTLLSPSSRRPHERVSWGRRRSPPHPPHDHPLAPAPRRDPHALIAGDRVGDDHLFVVVGHAHVARTVREVISPHKPEVSQGALQLATSTAGACNPWGPGRHTSRTVRVSCGRVQAPSIVLTTARTLGLHRVSHPQGRTGNP